MLFLKPVSTKTTLQCALDRDQAASASTFAAAQQATATSERCAASTPRPLFDRKPETVKVDLFQGWFKA